MHKRDTARVLATMAAFVGLAWPSAQAFAQVGAYTSSPVDLYAGPSGDYPVVSEIGPGVPVTVMGCVSDYSWCDVALPDLRGWVYATYLSYPYEGEYVPLQGYGSVIGLPIIGFSLGAYWGSYYRDRPWYGERERWAHMPSPGYGGRPDRLPPRAGVPGPYGRAPEVGRPPALPPNGMRAPEPGRPGQPPEPGRGRPPESGRPGQPPAGGHPWGAPGSPGNYGGAPRPEGGNGGQPHPMPPQGVRPPAPQGGFRPGGPAGGFEHGAAPAMRAPGPMPARPAGPPPQGGHPSGEGGGYRGEGRQPG